MTTARRPGRPPRTSITEILDTAEVVGLTRLTRLAVAEQLGVSPATIRHHVESTRRLYSLTAARIFDRLDVMADHAQGWQEYLLVVGDRFAHLVGAHPGLDDYVLRGPYEPTTLERFECIMSELRGRDDRISRPVAHLLGSRALLISAATQNNSFTRYTADSLPPNAGGSEIAEWTLRAFLQGAGQLIVADDMPATMVPTPDALWTHMRK